MKIIISWALQRLNNENNCQLYLYDSQVSISVLGAIPWFGPRLSWSISPGIIPLTQTLSLLHSLPSPEASQRLLLLLLLMLMKEPLPWGVHARRPHAWPHGHVPTTVRGTRQLTPHWPHGAPHSVGWHPRALEKRRFMRMKWKDALQNRGSSFLVVTMISL